MQRKNRIAPSNELTESCPFVDADEASCESRFNLGRVEQAFTICFGNYEVCPMFLRLQAAPTETSPTVTVTVFGHERALHATGT